MLYPARWKRITVDQSKVLKIILFRFVGPPGIWLNIIYSNTTVFFSFSFFLLFLVALFLWDARSEISKLKKVFFFHYQIIFDCLNFYCCISQNTLHSLVVCRCLGFIPLYSMSTFVLLPCVSSDQSMGGTNKLALWLSLCVPPRLPRCDVQQWPGDSRRGKQYTNG